MHQSNQLLQALQQIEPERAAEFWQQLQKTSPVQQITSGDRDLTDITNGSVLPYIFKKDGS